MKKILVILLLTFGVTSCYAAQASVTEASYYTVASCLKESGQYTMANGRLLDDNKFTCASWDYPFGTRLEITNRQTNRKIVAIVTDRGPSKKLYKKGRKIDLSKAAFEAIADLKSGLVDVDVEVLP